MYPCRVPLCGIALQATKSLVGFENTRGTNRTRYFIIVNLTKFENFQAAVCFYGDENCSPKIGKSALQKNALIILSSRGHSHITSLLVLRGLPDTVCIAKYKARNSKICNTTNMLCYTHLMTVTNASNYLSAFYDSIHWYTLLNIVVPQGFLWGGWGGGGCFWGIAYNFLKGL